MARARAFLRSYDFLNNGEVSTGLVKWREAAWAWRSFVASAILAPYDEQARAPHAPLHAPAPAP